MAELETEILLVTGASRDTIFAAAADSLVEADRWHIVNVFADSVVAHLATAHLDAGDVLAAAALVEPRVEGLLLTELRATQGLHCAVLMRRGKLAEARAHLVELSAIGFNYAFGTAGRDLLHADVELWDARPGSARDLLLRAASFLLDSGYAGTSGQVLVAHARAEADLLATGADRSARTAAHQRVLDLRDSGSTDPLDSRARGVALLGRLLWSAELARIDGTASVDQWSDAAQAWDALGRPHDAAYCRWRAAQVALGEGQGTLPARVLKRAASDAREHVPLSRAIAATAAGAYH